MTTREVITSGYYDLVSPAFQCVADAIGVGRIFEFPCKDVDGEDLVISVLARDSSEAFELFKDYLENEESGLACGHVTKTFGIRL